MFAIPPVVGIARRDRQFLNQRRVRIRADQGGATPFRPDGNDSPDCSRPVP